MSCGESSLDRAGQGSTDWIGQGAPSTTPPPPLEITTTTLPPGPEEHLSSAEGLEWLNEGLDGFEAESPEAVVDLVWDASNGVNSFVQANRSSIALALPGVRFPATVPDEVGYVTSQLVFSTPGGAMNEEWLAAFGLWTVTPYSASRAVGQSVVLYVGRDISGADSDPSRACDLMLGIAKSSCTDQMVEGLGWASRVSVPDGVKLAWSDGLYRYELFHRTSGDFAVAELMAGVMIELSSIESEAGEAFLSLLNRVSVTPSG